MIRIIRKDLIVMDRIKAILFISYDINNSLEVWNKLECTQDDESIIILKDCGGNISLLIQI